MIVVSSLFGKETEMRDVIVALVNFHDVRARVAENKRKTSERMNRTNDGNEYPLITNRRVSGQHIHRRE